MSKLSHTGPLQPGCAKADAVVSSVWDGALRGTAVLKTLPLPSLVAAYEETCVGLKHLKLASQE